MSLWFFCFRLSVKWCQAAVQSFGLPAEAVVHKPIPHDKWDLIRQVFCVISVGNECLTSVLIRLIIAGSSVPSAVMWWAGGMLTRTVCRLTQLNFIWRQCFIICFKADLCNLCIYLHPLGRTWKIWTSWSNCEYHFLSKPVSLWQL